uniref:J domain-containing protein n=1 Tax=viral metagenome TaxID=1070528 RepID=A0A6C0JDD7_9ZZZZ
MTNHYEILGVSNDAGDGEIKKAYRVLSLKYHPDRNSSDDAVTKMHQINEAYEVLSDQGKRQQYDMELQFGGMGGPMGGMPFTHMNSMNEFSDMNNIFNMMFGGGIPGMGQGMHGGPNIRVFHGGMPGMNVRTEFFHHNMNARPEPISQQIQITLQQSYTGCNFTLDIERTVIENNARRSENETVYLTIPPGIDNDEVMILSDKGNNVNGQKGELRLQIKVSNNTEFKRNGLDLTYNKKVNLKDALCGFVFEIPHLNGKLLSLNNNTNPSIIKPNYRKVVPNMGMKKDNSTGNLIIEFEVEFPDSLTSEQIDGLKNIL